MRKIVILSLLFFLVLSFFSYVAADDNRPVENKEDVKKDFFCLAGLGKSHDFTLENMAGEKVKLSDFEGKTVILFFWTTWCTVCHDFILQLNEAYPVLKEKGVELIAINMKESKRKVERSLKKMPMDFPVLLDKDNRVTQSFAVFAPPTFIIIDAFGRIQFQNHFWPYDYEKYICK